MSKLISISMFRELDRYFWLGFFLVVSIFFQVSDKGLGVFSMKHFGDFFEMKKGPVFPSSLVFCGFFILSQVKNLKIKLNPFLTFYSYMLIILLLMSWNHSFKSVLLFIVKISVLFLHGFATYFFIQNGKKLKKISLAKGYLTGFSFLLFMIILSPVFFEHSWQEAPVNRLSIYIWGLTIPNIYNYLPSCMVIMYGISSIMIFDPRFTFSKVMAKKIFFWILVTIAMTMFLMFTAVRESILSFVVIYPLTCFSLLKFRIVSVKSILLSVLLVLMTIALFSFFFKSSHLSKRGQDIAVSMQNAKIVTPSPGKGRTHFASKEDNKGGIEKSLDFLSIRFNIASDNTVYITPDYWHQRLHLYTGKRFRIWMRNFIPLIRGENVIMASLFSPFLFLPDEFKLGEETFSYRLSKSSHSFYLDIFLRFGLVGLCLLLVCIFFVFEKTFEICKEIDDQFGKSYAVVCIGSFILIFLISSNLRTPLLHPYTAIIHGALFSVPFGDLKKKFKDTK